MPTLLLEHSDLARGDRLSAVLQDHGHRLVSRRLHRGDAVPGDLEKIDALVVLGGAQDPLDDGPSWVEPEFALLRAAHEAEIPIVGICLGCQLLGRALGGTVERSPDGLACGWHDVRLTPAGREDPLFAGFPWTSRQLCWHEFQVTTPPAGARVLAASDHCPVEAWALGMRTYAFQFHPESYATTLASWADDDPQALAKAGVARAELDAATQEHAPGAARLAERLFERIALLLMPIDRRDAGLAAAH